MVCAVSNGKRMEAVLVMWHCNSEMEANGKAMMRREGLGEVEVEETLLCWQQRVKTIGTYFVSLPSSNPSPSRSILYSQFLFQSLSYRLVASVHGKRHIVDCFGAP